uniref:FI16918p1 n=1 Tax=Drosophila melanogaster TaxID=7227 RepID=Q6IK96_DROME|eukprot:NP_001247057.1 uncharacterized protein Dmel_CG43062 [Drosophila melanogaster]
MGISPQCWPIKNKTFVFLCRGIHERRSKKKTLSTYYTLPHYHNQDENHKYAFFHVENDSRVFFITIGRSRLNNLDWFLVDKWGKFIRNGTSVYDYHTGFECVYKRIHFLERLLKECLAKQNSTQRNSTNPELMVLHFPETKAPTYHMVSIGDNTRCLNWVICLLGLVILLCCLK